MYAEGYKYWLAYKTNAISYYRCFRHISSKCPGRCVNENGKIRTTAAHNHPPEVDKALIDKFRKILTYRAATEKTELYAIYCDEATTRHSDAAMLYPFTSAESAMRKARRKQLPQIPSSVGEVINVLDNSSELFRVHSGRDKDSIYQKTINLEDSICMIFMHRKTYELFSRIEEILLDGSLDFIPNTPPHYYLLIVHAVQGDIIAPLVYSIFTAKTQSAYSACFTYLREELHIIPKIVMSDFDQTMQSLLAYAFPEAIIKGCWFHYTDAVLSKMKNLSLQRETTKGVGASGLRMLLVLPLLPAEYMAPGLDSLRKWLKEKSIFSAGFSELCDYIEHGWLRAVGAEKMSIFGTTRILSNHTRNFNKELSGMIGVQNPVIWVILDSITQLATKVYVKVSKRMKTIRSVQTVPKNPSCARSQSITSPSERHQKKKSELVRDTIISSATQLWIKTPVHLRNPLQFLQLSSHCINESLCLSSLSDVKEKVFSNSSRKSTQPIIGSSSTIINTQHQNSNNWPQQQPVVHQLIPQQQLLQQHQHQHEHQHQHQNQLQQDLADLSMDVNFLDHQTHLGQPDYSSCSLGQDDFILTQLENPSLHGETINDHKNNYYLNSYDTNTNNQSMPQYQQNVQILPVSSNPPPLAFFPFVKRLSFKRRLPVLSEPPPLVPIQSKTLCK